MIRFNCSSCGKLVQVSDEYAGKEGQCPHCQTLMEVPQASAVDAAAPSASSPPAPAVEPEPWYYAVGGQRQGPVSAPALAAQIQAGQLPATVQIWRGGMDNWVPANTVAEFRQVAAPSAPGAVPLAGQVVQAGTPAVQWQGEPRNCGQAIAALVLGLIPCTCVPSLLAIIFGHIALSKIDQSGGELKGRGMAIAGLVLGYLFTAANIIYGIVTAASQ